MNLLRCRTETFRLKRLTSSSGRWISNCVVDISEARLIDGYRYQYIGYCQSLQGAPVKIRKTAPGCAIVSAAGWVNEAARRTPSRRDPCRRCGRLVAADGSRRGRDA